MNALSYVNILITLAVICKCVCALNSRMVILSVFLARLNDIVACVWVLPQTKRVWIAVIMICHDLKAGGSFLSKTPDTHTKKRPHTPADITVHQHIPFVNNVIYFTQHPTLTWIQVLLVSSLRQANIFAAECATIKVSERQSLIQAALNRLKHKQKPVTGKKNVFV